MKKSPGTTTQQNKERKRTSITLFVAFALVIAGVIAFIGFYNSYIDSTLYAERLNQMREVTTQLFSGLEDVVKNQWRVVDEQCRTLQDNQPKNLDELQTFMEKQFYLSDLGSVKSNVVAVDESGAYYTQKGQQGLIPEREYLFDDIERLSYVTNSLTTDETRMVFLKRLENPITIQDNDNGSFKLEYYGISQNMEELNPYFECTAYGGNNSVYVIDNNGLKLFSSSSSSSGDLLQGYNVLTTLGEMSYLHGSSFDNTKKELDEKNIAYSNALLDNTEIFYSLYRMDNAAWTLLFLVPSQYVATNTVDLVNTTIRLVLIFSVVLIVISIAVITWVLRTQQKAAIDAERENSAKLEKLNIDLQSASRAKTEFLSNMSHDIRTPMNAIVGITKLMEHDKRDPEKMDTYIQKIQLSSRHLLSLINDVLDMSKIESSSVTLNKEPVKLSEQIGQIESIVRPQIEDRKQKLDIQIHDIVHENLIGDAVRLRQILINLLSNAVKYTPNGGNITLEFTELPCDVPDSAKFCVSVTDTGYGMTKEFVEHIFEPFTRAENSTTNKVQGTGLGMAITKNIVDLMGGTINVQSEVNKGSRFEITITLVIDKSSAVTLPCRNFLLISDENDLVQNARAAFSENDAVLNIAQSEAEADEVLLREPVEVVLLGGRLMGQQLADGIKRLREKTGTALLLYCCDYSEHDQLDRISENGGIDGVLARPFFLSNLAKAIDRVQNKAPDYSEESGSILNGMRFLCAEDNALNAEILEAILDMNNASCVIYPNGKEISEAFENVKEGDFDAILMDVQMPVMNGLDASRVIRRSNNPLGKTIPIIAMTANAFSEDVQNCLNAGMDAHISKPLDIAVLERTLKSISSRLNRHTV